MKKIFMTMAIALISIIGANAQLTIGGAVGFGGTTGTSSKVSNLYTDENETQFNFYIAPSVGYVFCDGKMEAGAALQYQLTVENEYTPSTDFTKMQKATSQAQNYLYVKPYVRYYVLQRNWFSLGLHGEVLLGGQFLTPQTYYVTDNQEKDAVTYANEYLKETYKALNPTYFLWGVGVVPVMKFAVNERWNLDVKLDAIGLYLNGGVLSYTNEDVKQTTATFNYGLNLFNNSTYASVGFAYKF